MNRFLIYVCLFICYNIKGQVLNIDRENGQDSVAKRFKCAVNFSFSSDKQKQDLIDFSNTTELDIFTKKDQVFILLGQGEFSFNGTTVLENNGYVQVRFRDNDKRKIYPDIFGQYQWNGIQGMENRSLGGINIRVRFLEKKTSDLYTSLGLFYESEKWNPFLTGYGFPADSLQIFYRNLVRLNLSAKFALKIAKGIDFSGSTFLQSPLNSHFNQPRWFFDSNLNFEVSKHIGFIIHYDHNIDTYRPLPIDTYFYNLSVGLQLKV